MSTPIATFAEFWPFYLREHSKPATRSIHFAGTTLSLVLIVGAIVRAQPVLFVPALLVGYAFAWYSHFFIEKNKPASFKQPLFSFAADWRMWSLILAGRLGPELEKAGVPGAQTPAKSAA